MEIKENLVNNSKDISLQRVLSNRATVRRPFNAGSASVVIRRLGPSPRDFTKASVMSMVFM